MKATVLVFYTSLWIVTAILAGIHMIKENHEKGLVITSLCREYQEEIFQPAYRASESEKEKMVKSYCRLYIPIRPRTHESGIYIPPLGPVTDMMKEWPPADRPEDNCRDGHPCSI